MADYIKPEDLVSDYEAAKKHMQALHEPFTEYERIANNRPHPGIAKEMPKVTDGTTASHIKERPKRIIQQIPTGTLEKTSDWLKIVGNYILEDVIIPNSNEVAAEIQKCWAMISKADIYGSQPAFVQFINRGDYFGTDWTLPYIKDVLLEPGKLSERDSNTIYLRTWWSKDQVKKQIEKEKNLSKSAKERGEKYESGWDLAELSKLMDEVTKKDDQALTPMERKRGQNHDGFIEIVHCFKRGAGECFYSFSPTTKAIIRKKVNPDPRGVIPIHFMYCDQDFSNPLGRGLVELAGPLQNLIDSEMQMYQYNRTLMLNPPLKVWGQPELRPKFAPHALWHMGVNREVADIEPVRIETSAHANFATNYGLMKSQLISLLTGGGGDNSIGASAGNPSFSKTQAGVKAQEARLGTNDNHVRKNFEDVYQEICETRLNLYFAERSGIQELDLGKEAANKLRKIAPQAVSPDGKIRIDYDEETPKLKFQINATSSMKQEASEQLEPLSILLERLEGSAILQQQAGSKIPEIYNAIVAASGVENPEKLQIHTEDEQGNPMEQAAPEEPQMTPEMVQQMIQEGIAQAMEAQASNDPANDPTLAAMKAVGIKFSDLAEDAQMAILENLGLPAGGMTPRAHEMMLKASDAAVRVAQLEQHPQPTFNEEI